MHDKGNYRPISVLPCISKIFESILTDQLQCHFSSLFCYLISGFRKGHSCQSVLTNFVETYVSKNWMRNNMWAAYSAKDTIKNINIPMIKEAFGH